MKKLCIIAPTIISLAIILSGCSFSSNNDNPQAPSVKSSIPSGTYSVQVFAIVYSIAFSGDTMALSDTISGQPKEYANYKYQISGDGTTIIYTGANGELLTQTAPEYQCTGDTVTFKSIKYTKIG